MSLLRPLHVPLLVRRAGGECGLDWYDVQRRWLRPFVRMLTETVIRGLLPGHGVFLGKEGSRAGVSLNQEGVVHGQGDSSPFRRRAWNRRGLAPVFRLRRAYADRNASTGEDGRARAARRPRR